MFSTREKAEDWLKCNGFLYRPRTFLKGDPLKYIFELENKGINVYYEKNGLMDSRYMKMGELMSDALLI